MPNLPKNTLPLYENPSFSSSFTIYIHMDFHLSFYCFTVNVHYLEEKNLFFVIILIFHFFPFCLFLIQFLFLFLFFIAMVFKDIQIHNTHGKKPHTHIENNIKQTLHLSNVHTHIIFEKNSWVNCLNEMWFENGHHLQFNLIQTNLIY